ncbi:MAG: diguanylate cyclase [Paludisphaera borealis]|uniref:diguanylate cyclase n=1 Tax=Paludisphaera borealis TaxID=1387353 RepID=UPI00284D363A|nr:diguanylate cyclase [Paludisphaera borealis]MDR3620584.1 diguanylate cyclase [Paludisphaera borealis]
MTIAHGAHADLRVGDGVATTVDQTMVLVVDDNPIDRLHAGALIERNASCKVCYAQNAAEALERLAQGAVSAIVTDLMMEGMSGLDLVRTIRREHPGIPVVLMTAHGSEEVAIEALRVGATDYVPKNRLAVELQPILERVIQAASSVSRWRRGLQGLIRKESQFILDNEPEEIASTLEFVKQQIEALNRWDKADVLRITIALDEALRNAVFHGNLGVSSELRQGDERRFDALVRERAGIAPYRDRRVVMNIFHDPKISGFVIRDQGQGFDVSLAERPIEPDELLRPSGRGLLLMRSFMDEVSFNAAGNEVTMIKRRPPDDRPSAHAVPCPADDWSVLPRTWSDPERLEIEAEPEADDVPAAVPLPEPESAGFDLYKALLDRLPDAVCFLDADHRVVYWNEAAERLSGYSRDEALHQPGLLDALKWTDHSGAALTRDELPLLQCTARERTVAAHLFLKRKDGRRIWVEVRSTPVRDDRGVLVGGLSTFRDATSSIAVEHAFRQIREAAERDPLTGLANRRHLDRMLDLHLQILDRDHRPFCLMIADLDHFKQINDAWGHTTGDRALVEFANLLQRQCRAEDLVARFGGEEFMVLFPDHTLETAARIAERLRANTPTATPRELGDRQLYASFGVAQAVPGETAQQLIRRADAALYRAKSLGRDRVEIEDAQDPLPSC